LQAFLKNKLMMKLRNLLPVFVIAALASGCDTETNDANCDFDAQAMRENYADNVIAPAFSDWTASTADLKQKAYDFATTQDASSLTALRAAFISSYKDFQHASPFAIGSGIINGMAFRDFVNTFPTNVGLINNYVAAGTVDAAQNPNSTVGYPALDFLLFGVPGTSEAEVLGLFTTGDDAANRKAYVVSLAERIHAIATQVNDGWSGFRSTFVNSPGSGEGSALEQLANQFNRDMENLKNFKLKIPLGKFNGGVVLPAQVEAYYSGTSAELANEQLTALRNMYLGVGSNGSDGLGLDDYLECLKAGADSDGLLSEAIRNQLQAIVEAFNLLQDPLSEQLVSNKPVVDDAHTQLQMLVPLTKREMSGALGVQVTYQSNDGD
jgi:uncharacterized protein